MDTIPWTEVYIMYFTVSQFPILIDIWWQTMVAHMEEYIVRCEVLDEEYSTAWITARRNKDEYFTQIGCLPFTTRINNSHPRIKAVLLTWELQLQ